jgi:hypothetical protein
VWKRADREKSRCRHLSVTWGGLSGGVIGDDQSKLSKNPAVPLDLAEWIGAVRLTGLVLEAVQAVEAPLADFRAGSDRPGYSFRMLLTLLSYAYSRGVFGSEELEERVRTDADLRYLCARELPDADTLRQFRRRQWGLLQPVLARLLAAATGTAAGDTSFDADSDAALRLERAAAADSMALDW